MIIRAQLQKAKTVGSPSVVIMANSGSAQIPLLKKKVLKET